MQKVQEVSTRVDTFTWKGEPFLFAMNRIYGRLKMVEESSESALNF